MPYKRVPRRTDAYSDAAVIKALGVSRPTFFRYLKAGKITGPLPIEGTQRRWWTESDVTLLREQIRSVKGSAV